MHPIAVSISTEPLAALHICFWTSTAALLYTFVGYGAIVRWLAIQVDSERTPPREAEQQRIVTVLVAHNEAARLSGRIENLLSQEFPAEQRDIIVISDGSTDSTGEVLGRFGSIPGLLVVEQAPRSGKARCINVALNLPAARAADVVVFADARQRFEPSAIARLLRWFADPEVGAVSGALDIAPSVTGVGDAIGTYWSGEKALREAESIHDSCIGCTGAIYAIRRTLFAPIPEDTLLDDVVIPMQIALQGYRTIFDPHARAFDPQPLEPQSELARKRRTLAGNFQMLFRYPEWLLPWRNRLWWQLVSHKYLRLAAPAFLLLALWSSGMLASRHPGFTFAFALQVAAYLLGAIGVFCPKLRNPIFAIPGAFLLLNTSTVRALIHYLFTSTPHHWSTSRAAAEKSS